MSIKNIKNYIYVDAANILMAFKDKDINILSALTFLSEKHKHSDKKYFSGYFSDDIELYKNVERLGYAAIYKKIYNEAYKIKANCDVEIAHAITKDLLCCPNLETLILVTGDGDFNHLIDYALLKKKTVIVYAADPLSCSKVFKRRNDIKLTYLIDMKEKFRNEKPPLGTNAV